MKVKVIVVVVWEVDKTRKKETKRTRQLIRFSSSFNFLIQKYKKFPKEEMAVNTRYRYLQSSNNFFKDIDTKVLQ